VSWQLAQPELTPLWICAVDGAGVANAVPGAVFVADAAISPAGMLPRWQVSQLVVEGMCELAPIGLVGGMPTMRLMPAKLADVDAATWHETQLLPIPAWFISEPLNLAPLATGRLVIDEPVPTWQLSHAALVGMWLPGMPTIEKLTAGIANDDAAAPWHCAQLLVVLGAFAWIADSVGITA